MDKTLPLLLLDFETQSRVSIINPHYTSHESTKILCMAWGFMGDKPSLWLPGDSIPSEIIEHVKNRGMLGASNARFDREIWEYVGVNDYDFPETDLEDWYCCQAQSRVAGLPSSLDNSAKALGIQGKLSSGVRLINKCSIPPFSTDPQDYIDLGVYCLRDWTVMDQVTRSIPDLTEVGLRDYHYNERVNDRGIKIDRELAIACQEYVDVERAEINGKITKLTDEVVTKCTQYVRVRRWIQARLEDAKLDDVVKLMVVYKTDKDTGETEKGYSVGKSVRANMLAGHKEDVFQLPPVVYTLLKLIDDAGGSATSKFKRMNQKASQYDDRVRGAIRYAGAP